MSVLGLGIDLVEVRRIEGLLARHGNRFVDRICRPGECRERRGDALHQHLAGLFAAKESVLKALGTGWAEGLGLRQVEVTRTAAGAPLVVLHDAARERFLRLGGERFHLSITHDGAYAAATAVLEGTVPSAAGSAAERSMAVEGPEAP